MTKGLTDAEGDPRVLYAEYIDMPHHQSPVRKRMSLYDRAAQFSPFAALTGYEDMVDEEARFVDSRAEVGEYGLEVLNRKLRRLDELLKAGKHPTVSITYFQPDGKKEGGKYVTAKEEISKIDFIASKILLTRTVGRGRENAAIDIASVSEISGDKELFPDGE